MNRKTERLPIRVDPETKSKAEIAADEEEMTTSAWIRAQIRIGFVQQHFDTDRQTPQTNGTDENQKR